MMCGRCVDRGGGVLDDVMNKGWGYCVGVVWGWCVCSGV